MLFLPEDSGVRQLTEPVPVFPHSSSRPRLGPRAGETGHDESRIVDDGGKER